MFIKDLFISFWQFTTKVILVNRPKVLFYYPQHFNRSAEGTNPFFDPMLVACEKNGISYLLIEEPDYGTDKPRNPKAIRGDAFFWLITILRKIAHVIYSGEDIYQNEEHIAKWINIITFSRLKCRNYVTISGSMQTLFSKIGGKCRAFDMQHGILENSNPGWFESKGKLKDCFKDPNIHWIVWGNGYKKSLMKGGDINFGERIHVVGYPITTTKEAAEISFGKHILFSLQITCDTKHVELEKAVWESALQQLSGKGVKVLIKHHPRFNNATSIDDWFVRYPFCELTNKSISELLPEVMLQLTIHSTTTFEYAEHGVPTFFIDFENKTLMKGALFYSEYNYPLYHDMTLNEVVNRLENLTNRTQDGLTIRKWYHDFYSDFNASEFLRLIEKSN